MEPKDVDFNEPPSPQDDVKALIRELKSLAFSDIGGLYDENNCLRDIKDMPEALRRAVAGIEVDEIWSGTGHAREIIGHTKKVKLWDKKGSIDSFMKHLGMFIERIENTTKVEMVVNHVDLEERINEITRNRVAGIK